MRFSLLTLGLVAAMIMASSNASEFTDQFKAGGIRSDAALYSQKPPIGAKNLVAQRRSLLLRRTPGYAIHRRSIEEEEDTRADDVDDDGGNDVVDDGGLL